MREPVYQRLYMFFVGSLLLFALYFELDGLVYALAALVIFEAVTDLRIVRLLIRLTGERLDTARNALAPNPACACRFNFPAERAWQLSMGPVLILSGLFGNAVWFIPWFIGLAVLGAGLSGVCPGLIALRAMGFK
jgi:hypothetical protein